MLYLLREDWLRWGVLLLWVDLLCSRVADCVFEQEEIDVIEEDLRVMMIALYFELFRCSVKYLSASSLYINKRMNYM